VARSGAHTTAEPYLDRAEAAFKRLGAARDLADSVAARSLLTKIGTGENVVSPADADDALVRRVVDAAALPELLARETAGALFDASAGNVAIVFEELPDNDVRLVASVGCDAETARTLARTHAHAQSRGNDRVFAESLGHHAGGARVALVVLSRPIGPFVLRRLKMIATVARQGFELCAARDRSEQPEGPAIDRSLEPLLPGFVTASAAMARVTEQIQRLQGNDLTVLITGESGTGKELIARAIHVGSHRSSATLLPYNCTTTGRDLADSQLFGHRRGSFTGAVADQPGVIRTAAGALEHPLEPLLPGFVCASAAMQRVAEQIQRMQGNDLTVLITGESGTGKDLVARAIHAGSLRRGNMFLPYNCTSATRELADSQLFGHRRGAFTGAIADQAGVLRTAVGGTLFLDEVGDLPIDVQPKLLRFLEQGEVLPVGDTRPQRVDVRVVAATNADLESRVSESKFREDLFYRLSVIRIHVPPLRERREEIPHLSTFFLREARERLGKPGVRLSPETLDLFDTFAWPGNVRQLRNEVQRAVAMASPEGTVTPDLLSPAFASERLPADPASRQRLRRTTLAAAVEKLEREMIEAALDRSAGNISESARLLGLTRRGLYLKMDRLRVGYVAG